LADWLHEREARRALRRLQPPDSVGPALERENQRILLTIPHPDDEVLGCHYFLETEASRQKIDLVYVTDGEGCATARLFDNIAAVRRAESAGATGKFAIAERFHWALADGGLASARDILAERLERHVKERPCDVLLGPAPNGDRGLRPRTRHPGPLLQEHMGHIRAGPGELPLRWPARIQTESR
jgi:hypothetical protein